MSTTGNPIIRRLTTTLDDSRILLHLFVNSGPIIVEKIVDEWSQKDIKILMESLHLEFYIQYCSKQ